MEVLQPGAYKLKTIDGKIDYDYYYGLRANLIRHKHQKELFVAVEGVYTGQYVYCGRRATLSIGDVLPLRGILEGAVVCTDKHHAR